jgi:outer membrane protein assembly factor BamB
MQRVDPRRAWLGGKLRSTLRIGTAFLSLFILVRLAGADDWPQWRGPEGNGISRAKNLPTTWSLEKNIVWKTPLPSWSGGTPVVWGDRIFVTSPTKPTPGNASEQQTSQDRRSLRSGQSAQRGLRVVRQGGYGGRRDAGGSALLLLCIARKDGAVLWQRELDQGNRVWNKQNASSPSPVTDGKHVWVVTGTGSVTAFTMDGHEVWKRHLQQEYGKFGLNWGYASSPLLYGGNLIIEVLHGNNTTDPSYLVALNGLTGKEVWRRIRPTDALRESPDAYTTPALLTYGGKVQIVVSGGDYVTGHDPKNGQEIWRAGGLNPGRQPNYRIVASPVVADGMIYAPSRRRPLLALRAGGTGDVTKSHLAWKWDDRGGPDVPTPVCDGKYFFMVDDSGMVTCLDAKTGKLLWGPERAASGTVDSSPLLADGKLYITNESGVTTVLAAGPEFKVLATNRLDDSYTLSSLAVSGNQLFLRTSTHLYCIGERAAK